MQSSQLQAQGEYLGIAFQINNPVVKDALTARGVTQDYWNNLSLPQQASLVQETLNVNGVMLEMDQRRMTNDMLAYDLAIKSQYGQRDISGEQALALLEPKLAELATLANKKKLSKDEAYSIEYNLEYLKSYAPSVNDPALRDRINRQIREIESKLKGLSKTGGTKQTAAPNLPYPYGVNPASASYASGGNASPLDRALYRTSGAPNEEFLKQLGLK
jgi:hypothetical protein